MHRTWVLLAVTQVDGWIANWGNGEFSGSQAEFESEVYMSPITNTCGTAIAPYVGTCDSAELVEHIV
ncbi:MAG: hypothetical protein V3U65_16320 [Granulosicoccaceae bacterium]